MTKKDDKEKNKLEEQDIVEEMQEEIEELENEEWVNEEWENEEDNIELESENAEVQKLKDSLLRVQADFDNFKKRADRDRDDMIFFLKSDIFKKILPRVDDLERIIKNTPEDMQNWPVYEWVLALEKWLKKDLKSMWVSNFESIWKEADPHKHDVMTQVPWKENVIIDEFEKWYELNDRILRHAKVVVGNWTEV